jgi:hypothetical protein
MPRDKEKHAESCRQYREANRDKIAEYDRQYYEANKERLLEKKSQYREANKQKIKEYNQTPAGKKSRRISYWKYQGIKLPDDYPDWDIFYDDEYMKTTHCEECLVKLTEDKRNTSTTKCVDHCHITGEFRNILCHRCNLRRG